MQEGMVRVTRVASDANRVKTRSINLTQERKESRLNWPIFSINN